MALGFVDNLSCSVIMNAATNSTFIDILSGPDLKALLRSINFWNCIPIDVIRTIMNNNKIGSKISLNDIVIAAPLLAKAKKIDEEVIVSLFRSELSLFRLPVPQLTNPLFCLQGPVSTNNPKRTSKGSC